MGRQVNRARLVKRGFADYRVESYNGFWYTEKTYLFIWNAKRGLNRYIKYGSVYYVLIEQESQPLLN